MHYTDLAATVTADLDESGRCLVPKVYPVFNAAQVDGWTPPHQHHLTTTADRDARADAWIAGTGAAITYGHNHAAYLPQPDRIELPDAHQFADTASFYSTTTHELCHWTAHPTRLARNLAGRFGDDAYTAEELVAELGAAIACAHLGITPTARDDHAAYLAHWLRILDADPKALFTVAARAQAAVVQFTRDTPVAPGRVVGGHLDDQIADRRGGGRPASWSMGLGPVPGDPLSVPAQQGVGRDDPAVAEPTGERSGDHGEQCPVIIVDRWSADLAAKHGELVAQHDDLEILGAA